MRPTQGCKYIQTLSRFCLDCYYILELPKRNAENLIKGRSTVPDKKNTGHAFDFSDFWNSEKSEFKNHILRARLYKLTCVLKLESRTETAPYATF